MEKKFRKTAYFFIVSKSESPLKKILNIRSD